MSEDLIRRSDAIPSADRPNKTKAELIAVMEEYRDKQLLMSDYWYGINWAINTIRTANISDEPSGEWIYQDDDIFAGKYYCDNCNTQAEVDLYGKWILSDYCPHCGARMKAIDGKE